MSVVQLSKVKAYLRVTHDDDDDLLQDLVDQAEAECLDFLDREALPKTGDRAVDECDSNLITDPASDSDDLAPNIRGGLYLVVQAMYEGMDPAGIIGARKAAEAKWFPYRNRLGV